MGKIQTNLGLIKNNPGIKFHSSPDHDKKYLKTKVKEYDEY